ncbi:MAG: hypothetical protein AAFA34_01630 [Thermoplasmata archaeon]
MLRSTIFYVGAVVVWGLSAALIAALLWSGAGWIFFETYGGAALGLIVGGFFWQAGRSARRAHRDLIDWNPGKPPESHTP